MCKRMQIIHKLHKARRVICFVASDLQAFTQRKNPQNTNQFATFQLRRIYIENVGYSEIYAKKIVPKFLLSLFSKYESRNELELV